MVALGFSTGGCRHPWTLSAEMCQRESLGGYAAGARVRSLDFTCTLVAETKAHILLKSWQGRMPSLCLNIPLRTPTFREMYTELGR